MIAQEANVGQLEAMEAFKVLRAPFDGTVTARNTDIGALINAGSGSPLFIVSQVAPLRVYVNVPESLAASVKAGTKANLTFDSFPGTRFPAEVVATAGAIDPTTRTLLTQLAVPNKMENFSRAHTRRFILNWRAIRSRCSSLRMCSSFGRKARRLGSRTGWQGLHPKNQDRPRPGEYSASPRLVRNRSSYHQSRR